MTRKRGHWYRVLGIAVVVIALAGAILTFLNTFGWAGHIDWSELGQFNVGIFEKQLREALPVGMSEDAAEAYLEREKIPFTYNDGSPPYLQIAKRDVYRAFLLFPGDLLVQVEFDRDRNISQVRISPQYK